MPRRAADFPDPVIGIAPFRRKLPEQDLLEVPDLRGGRQLELARDMEGVEQLAVDVDLELAAGGIADAHRSRTPVTGEPGQLDLGKAALAGEAVHDLELVRVPGGGAEQP